MGWEAFSSSSHFPLTIPRSVELASKKGGNCNNVTPREEGSQCGSHVTTIIQNFTLVSMTSTITPHPVRLLLGATVSSHPTHLTTYNSLSSTRLKGISGCRNYLCFVHLLRNEIYHFLSVTGWCRVNYWLDAIRSLLYKDVSLVIGIDYSLLARWQGLIFSMSLVLVRIY